MTVRRRQGELAQAVFRFLQTQSEPVQASRVIEHVANDVGMTEYEAADYPNRPGVKRLDKTLRFATIPAVKAGWLYKAKGRWTITEDGVTALQTYQDPAELMQASLSLYRQWRKNQSVTADEIEEGDEEEATAATTLEEAEEAAWAGIADYLNSMPPYEFQDLVAALLTAMGYHVAWVAPPGPDQGFDIVAFTDPLGAEGPRIKVQVKRQTSSKVAVDGLRSFMAVLSNSDVGIFVASGSLLRRCGRPACRTPGGSPSST